MDEVKNISSFMASMGKLFINKFMKNQKFIFKLIIYLIFIYQLIQLIIDYTKFKMNNKYELRNFMEEVTITLCFDENKILSKDNFILVPGFAGTIRKNELTITRRYFRGKYCFTYISYTFEEYILAFNFTFDVKSLLVLTKTHHILFKNDSDIIILIVNPKNSLSHFGNIFYLKPKYEILSQYIVSPEYSMRKLLPWPFGTDCYDYNSPSSLFESREYCYLDEMRKLELKYCKVNKYWTVDPNKQGNVSQCIEPDYNYLNKICKVNCLDVKIEYKIILVDFKVKIPGMSAAIIIDNNVRRERIYLTYLPEFTKLEFFSTMGGLIGLWLGLSIYEFLLKCIMIFKILIFEFITTRSYEIIKTLFDKIELCLKFLIIAVMVINLKLLFSDFVSGQKITKTEIIEEVDLPELVIENFFDILHENCLNYFEKLQKKLSKN